MEKVSPVSEVVKSCQDREGREEQEEEECMQAQLENGQLCCHHTMSANIRLNPSFSLRLRSPY